MGSNVLRVTTGRYTYKQRLHNTVAHLVISTIRPKAVKGARQAAPSTAAAPTTTSVVGSATPHLRHTTHNTAQHNRQYISKVMLHCIHQHASDKLHLCWL
jgi:hypothetical protein